MTLKGHYHFIFLNIVYLFPKHKCMVVPNHARYPSSVESDVALRLRFIIILCHMMFPYIMCLRHDSSQSLWHVPQWGQRSHCVGCSSVKLQRHNSSLEQLRLIKHCLALIRLCLTHLCLAYSHFYPDSRFTRLDMRAFQWVRNQCTKIRHRIHSGCISPGSCSSLLGSNVDALERHVLVDDFFPPKFLVASLISMSPYGNSRSLVAGCPLHCVRQPGER